MKSCYPFILAFVAMAEFSGANAACIKDLTSDATLSLRSGPGTANKIIASIPANSCRVVTDVGSCDNGWCRASYDGKFGWAAAKYLQNDRTGDRRDANFFVLKAVFDVVSKRHGRDYDLQKSYSEELRYRPTSTPSRRFYDSSGFKYPGGAGPTQCVAAVSEVLIETINQIFAESSDAAPFVNLPASHFSADAGMRKLRPHIWEYSEANSKGAAHALERFNIGRQISINDMSPGDLIKINRDGGAGHSTIFIGYVDKSGKLLERYSGEVKGIRYFSAQKAGVDLAGRPTNGLSFRTEYFLNNCPDQSTRRARHCHIFPPTSPYRPNMGFMLHPSAWGEIGSNLRKELTNRAYAARMGVPPTGDYSAIIASSTEGDRQGIAADVEAELNKPVDFGQQLRFER